MFKDIRVCLQWVMSRKNKHNYDTFKNVMKTRQKLIKSLRFVHVTGTNGKGSVVSFMRDGLNALGLKVGTFQSPHFLTHLDRIRIDNVNIEEEKFLEYVNKNYEFILEHELNMFEIDFLVMCEYFVSEKVDLAIVEVGIGGRKDYTNVILNPLLCVITTIGFDHQNKLGNTISKIAYEKAGIIKEKTNLLVGDVCIEAFEVIKRCALEKNVEVQKISPHINYLDNAIVFKGVSFGFEDIAKYQLYNLAISITGIEIITRILNIDLDLLKVQEKIKHSKWLGRFEIISKKPLVIIDGAHNIEGIKALINSLSKVKKPIGIIFSALEHKNYLDMLKELENFCDFLFLTQFNFENCIDVNKVEIFGKIKIEKDYRVALEKSLKLANTTVFCGSLYFLSDIYDYLKERFNA